MRNKIIILFMLCLILTGGCAEKEYIRTFTDGKRLNENIKGKWVFNVDKGNDNYYFGVIKNGNYIEIEDKFNTGSPHWSPDGKYIAVKGFDQIVIYTDELKFVKKINLKYPKGFKTRIKDIIWIPDGRLMYCIGKKNVKTEKAILFIYQMNIWTKEKTEIWRKENVIAGPPFTFNDISPNGKKILYDFDNWLSIMDMDGKNDKKIYRMTHAGFLDNENIFLDTNRAENGEGLRPNSFGQIRTWNLEKGKVIDVIEKDSMIFGGAYLTPDKKYLYYERSYEDGKYLVMHKLGQRKDESEIVVTYPELNETEHKDVVYIVPQGDGLEMEVRVNMKNPEQKYPKLMEKARKKVTITKEKHYTQDTRLDVWYAPEDMGWEYGK
ncbi:hypothetical protein ACFL4A_01630 [bacterium]